MVFLLGLAFGLGLIDVWVELGSHIFIVPVHLASAFEKRIHTKIYIYSRLYEYLEPIYQISTQGKVHKIITKINQKPPYLKNTHVNLHPRNPRVLPYVRSPAYNI